MDFKQDHDPDPQDFTLEQEIALYQLQQQVRRRQVKPEEADRYMRHGLDAHYYDSFSEVIEGKLAIDGLFENGTPAR